MMVLILTVALVEDCSDRKDLYIYAVRVFLQGFLEKWIYWRVIDRVLIIKL